MSTEKSLLAKAIKIGNKDVAEIARCTLCGEGIGPGIRPKEDQHADPLECFKAMQRAVRETRDVLRELVGSIKAEDLRVIKTTFGYEREADGSVLWSIIVTDPLGNEDRMARLVANTWVAVYEAATGTRLRKPKTAAPTAPAPAPEPPTA